MTDKQLAILLRHIADRIMNAMAETSQRLDDISEAIGEEARNELIKAGLFEHDEETYVGYLVLHEITALGHQLRIQAADLLGTDGES